jgi:hypothetical protein
LATSDSLKATVIVSVPELTISTKPLEDELLDEPLEPLEPLEPPRLPALLEPAADELDDALDPEPDPLELPDPLDETSSPGEMA